MPSRRQREKTQVTQAWKSLMSSFFNYKASKDRSSLEFQAWGEGRWANHQGSKSLAGGLGRTLAVLKGREPPTEEELRAPGGVGGSQHQAWGAGEAPAQQTSVPGE